MRAEALIVISVTLSACATTGSTSPDAAAAPAASASTWLEIPLSEGTFREHGAEFRTDTIDIPLLSLNW